MKMMGNLKFLSQLGLAVLALSLSPGLGRAQEPYKGKFTLPFEAHWGGAVLPAGDYTISMPTTAAPYLLFVRGEGKTVFLLAQGVSEEPASDDSKLIVINAAGTETIRSLKAGQIGLAFDYSMPKSKMPPMPASTGEANPMTTLLIRVKSAYGATSGR